MDMNELMNAANIHYKALRQYIKDWNQECDEKLTRALVEKGEKELDDDEYKRQMYLLVLGVPREQWNIAKLEYMRRLYWNKPDFNKLILDKE